MVRKFVVYKNEMHEVDSFLEGREQWEQVVKYKDYAVLHDLLREVLDNIDPEWDLAGGTQDKLEKTGLL